MMERRIGPRRDLAGYMGRATELNMHVLGPGEPALSEWAALGLQTPDMDAVRRYRLDRVRETLAAHDYAGILLFDPIHMRYALDSTNMQVWITHNAARYVMVLTEGPAIMWDYPTAEFLSGHLPLVDEIRVATSLQFMYTGEELPSRAEGWAAEIADLVRRHGGANQRLAVDHLGPAGLQALEGQGLVVGDGEPLMELARSIKSPDEIDALRCAIAAADAAVSVMRSHLEPGITEQRLWSYLHAENIARNGEWIETRLLASGPRTNPWFQECSSRVIELGDLVAFDTDLIGPYGYCVDYSRTWLCGDSAPSPIQRSTFELARQQLDDNLGLLEPGISFEELTFKANVPDPDLYRHYSVLFHGVGMADEWPSVYFPDTWETGGYHGTIEPGMVLAVESFVGPYDEPEGVKLEQMVLVSETDIELLTEYPIGLED